MACVASPPESIAVDLRDLSRRLGRAGKLGAEALYGFMKAYQAVHPVRVMSRVLELSASGSVLAAIAVRNAHEERSCSFPRPQDDFSGYCTRFETAVCVHGGRKRNRFDARKHNAAPDELDDAAECLRESVASAKRIAAEIEGAYGLIGRRRVEETLDRRRVET